MKRGFHYVSILNDEYGVYLCFDKSEVALKKINKYVGSYNLEPISIDDFECRGKTFLPPDCVSVIWVDKKKGGLATLAHEACHAVRDILISIGEKDLPDEVFAHSVGAIVRYAQVNKLL